MSERRISEAPIDPRLPYSKGLMARAYMGTGIAPDRAWELARLVEAELNRGPDEQPATQDEVYDAAARVLGEHEDEQAVRRLRRFQRLQELDRPLIVLVGGATGTGKSTITTEVAHRLSISRVSSTDFVRQTMRAFFSEDFMPTLHYSSFEAGPAVLGRHGDPRDAHLRGFLDQTRNVLVGVRAVMERALTEGHSMALEGVHLVPGMVPGALDGAIVSTCVIAISDEERHASHFFVRDADSDGVRPVAKYIDSLREIREIQDYLVEQAEKHGVPVIENDDRERAVDEVLRLVLDTFERAAVPA